MFGYFIDSEKGRSPMYIVAEVITSNIKGRRGGVIESDAGHDE